jgi:hypothetical protein
VVVVVVVLGPEGRLVLVVVEQVQPQLVPLVLLILVAVVAVGGLLLVQTAAPVL